MNLLATVGQFRPWRAAEFLESLQNLDFQNPAWLYESQPTDSSPWQGDVITEADIHWTGASGDPVQYTGPVMLISHGCDTELRDPTALLAPVLDLSEYLDLPEIRREYDTSDKHLSFSASIRGNEILNLFYLPAVRQFPDRIVHFSYTSAVANTVIQQAFQRCDVSQRLRLTDAGWYLLTGKLAHLFGRVEDFSDYPREPAVVPAPPPSPPAPPTST